ncbi:MAG: hypothetical protein AAF532_15830 [Planctomycetota bacterium]
MKTEKAKNGKWRSAIAVAAGVGTLAVLHTFWTTSVPPDSPVEVISDDLRRSDKLLASMLIDEELVSRPVDAKSLMIWFEELDFSRKGFRNKDLGIAFAELISISAFDNNGRLVMAADFGPGLLIIRKSSSLSAEREIDYDFDDISVWSTARDEIFGKTQ